MRVVKDYTIHMTQDEYNKLLGVLAYQGRLVDYNPGASQPDKIAADAALIWHEIAEDNE